MEEISQKLNFIWRDLKQEEKLKAFGIVAGFSLFAAVVLNVLVISSVYLNKIFPEKISILILAASIIISLAVVPKILYEKIEGFSSPISIDLRSILFFIIVFTILVKFVGFNLTVHFLAVGISEEVLFRHLHLKYLEPIVGQKVAVIYTSLLFAFLLHMGEPVLANLLVRLPIGVGLALIRIRFGLNSAITCHWIYDILSTIL